jgi:enoyl-CoA hydratase/carnithine racemase
MPVSQTEVGYLQLDRDAAVLRITLDRSEKRNALSLGMLQATEEALKEVAADRSIRVVVLAANGPVFCAGHDLKEMVDRDEEDYRELFETCTRVMLALRDLPQPVIARVDGLATAAGCQLVAACDLAVASSRSSFATPGIKIGLFCTTPMTPLVRAVLPKIAMEMLLTGNPISAERAAQAGLINRVVPPEQLDSVVDSWTNAISASSFDIVQLGKRAFYDQLPLSEPEAYRRATETMIENAMLDDAKEGISAFLAKRPPRWSPE